MKCSLRPKRDAQDCIIFFKKFILGFGGFCSYRGLFVNNKLNVQGIENLDELPNNKVLIISNHQTYFTDGQAILHAIAQWQQPRILGLKILRKIGFLYMFFHDLGHCYYITAFETMHKGILPRLYNYSGAINVRRSYKDGEKVVKRPIDKEGITKIHSALEDGWVINFIQGTTLTNAAGRKGAAYIVKECQPIILPVVIKGFTEAFSRKKPLPFGLRKKGVNLSMTFKPVLSINYSDPVEKILGEMMESIEEEF